MTDFWIGAILVTILLVLWRFCRCKHAWELVDKTELPSPVEEAKKVGSHLKFSGLDIPDALPLYTKRIILVIRCPKCGAVEVFREKST